MSHTPGPWEAILHPNGWHVVGEPKPDSFLPNKRKQIVFVGHMREDDANLIAAAPDLLEAVKNVSVVLSLAGLKADAEMLRQLIDKAEGRE